MSAININHKVKMSGAVFLYTIVTFVCFNQALYIYPYLVKANFCQYCDSASVVQFKIIFSCVVGGQQCGLLKSTVSLIFKSRMFNLLLCRDFKCRDPSVKVKLQHNKDTVLQI